MALPPRAAAAPMPSDTAAAEPALETSGVGEPTEEGADPWQPLATILKNDKTGELMLITGDEPDDGSEPEGQTFPDGPTLMRALMDVLEGGSGAEEGFEEGFKGPKAPPPMAA